MQLWNKGTDINREILAFTVGDDHLLDLKLVPYDCVASKAHARMLGKIGVLTQEEAAKLCACLDGISALAKQGRFTIAPEEEDCHTAIENHLVRECGEAGKRIHTARSRNDQVLTALRLYEKDAIAQAIGLIQALAARLRKKADAHKDAPMPGYTHMRKAMPTTAGTWLSSFADALADDAELLAIVGVIVDKSPLGTGPGFGVPVFAIEREMTAREMGFARVQENPVYAQLSRGKLEAMLLSGLVQVMLTLNRLASDLALFSMQGYAGDEGAALRGRRDRDGVPLDHGAGDGGNRDRRGAMRRSDDAGTVRDRGGVPAREGAGGGVQGRVQDCGREALAHRGGKSARVDASRSVD